MFINMLRKCSVLLFFFFTISSSATVNIFVHIVDF